MQQVWTRHEIKYSRGEGLQGWGETIEHKMLFIYVFNGCIYLLLPSVLRTNRCRVKIQIIYKMIFKPGFRLADRPGICILHGMLKFCANLHGF